MDKSPRHGSTVAQMVSPLKLMQRMRGGGGTENLLETNRKMQRALEEALMKNIHLQKVCCPNYNHLLLLIGDLEY